MSQSTIRKGRGKISAKLPPKPEKPMTREKLRAWEKKLNRLWNILSVDWETKDQLAREVGRLAEVVKADPDPLVNIMAGLRALLAKHYPDAVYASLFIRLPGDDYPGLTIPMYKRPAPAAEKGGAA